jgi:hypothetical protein
MVTEQLAERIDKYSRSARIFYNVQRWMAFRMHILSALVIGPLAWYLVYVKNDTAFNAGFSLNMASRSSSFSVSRAFHPQCNRFVVTFTDAIFDWVLIASVLEGQSMSLHSQG